MYLRYLLKKQIHNLKNGKIVFYWHKMFNQYFLSLAHCARFKQLQLTGKVQINQFGLAWFAQQQSWHFSSQLWQVCRVQSPACVCHVTFSSSVNVVDYFLRDQNWLTRIRTSSIFSGTSRAQERLTEAEAHGKESGALKCDQAVTHLVIQYHYHHHHFLIFIYFYSFLKLLKLYLFSLVFFLYQADKKRPKTCFSGVGLQDTA